MSDRKTIHLTDSKVRVRKDCNRWQVTFPRTCPEVKLHGA